MTITSLRTPLRTTTLAAAEGSVTGTMTTATAEPKTLSGTPLRTMLNASRASSDPVAVGSRNATTQMAANPISLILELLEAAKMAAEATGTIDWQMAGEKWKQDQGIK